jgi:hypothetical protein
LKNPPKGRVFQFPHDSDIGLHGRMRVSAVEKEIEDSMGFRVQILNPDGSNAKNT